MTDMKKQTKAELIDIIKTLSNEVVILRNKVSVLEGSRNMTRALGVKAAEYCARHGVASVTKEQLLSEALS
jgi:hypothetical protein